MITIPIIHFIETTVVTFLPFSVIAGPTTRKDRSPPTPPASSTASSPRASPLPSYQTTTTHQTASPTPPCYNGSASLSPAYITPINRSSLCSSNALFSRLSCNPASRILSTKLLIPVSCATLSQLSSREGTTLMVCISPSQECAAATVLSWLPHPKFPTPSPHFSLHNCPRFNSPLRVISVYLASPRWLLCAHTTTPPFLSLIKRVNVSKKC